MKTQKEEEEEKEKEKSWNERKKATEQNKLASNECLSRARPNLSTAIKQFYVSR